jgi:hypothetical protein
VVLAAVIKKSSIFWDIKPRSSLKSDHLSACCLLHAGVFFGLPSTLMMVVIPEGKNFKI